MITLTLTFLAGCLLTGEAVWLGIVRPMRRERDGWAERWADRQVCVGDLARACRAEREAHAATQAAHATEQDAHRATGAELRHAEGQAANLRAQLATTRACIAEWCRAGALLTEERDAAVREAAEVRGRLARFERRHGAKGRFVGRVG